jgi:hypothetical protein
MTCINYSFMLLKSQKKIISNQWSCLNANKKDRKLSPKTRKTSLFHIKSIECRFATCFSHDFLHKHRMCVDGTFRTAQKPPKLTCDNTLYLFSNFALPFSFRQPKHNATSSDSCELQNTKPDWNAKISLCW